VVKYVLCWVTMVRARQRLHSFSLVSHDRTNDDDDDDDDDERCVLYCRDAGGDVG
jgi:hypothetical protein